jgi:hypothetical protein
MEDCHFSYITKKEKKKKKTPEISSSILFSPKKFSTLGA